MAIIEMRVALSHAHSVKGKRFMSSARGRHGKQTGAPESVEGELVNQDWVIAPPTCACPSGVGRQTNRVG